MRRSLDMSSGLVSKLFTYSVAYGLLYVCYIDLMVPGSMIPGYHVWLIVTYFIPFIPLLLLLGPVGWRLVVSLGLTASLMNDLFYHPIGILLFQRPYNLYEWYMFQLGFKGFAPSWTFNAGVFAFPITSILMGTTIYLRVTAILALTLKRLRYKLPRIQH